MKKFLKLERENKERIFYDCPTSKVNQKVYQKGKGKDSPGSFGFKRAKKANQTTL